MFVSKKIAVLVVVGGLLSAGGMWTYKLAWGRPLNINHFYERVLIERMLDDPELLSALGLIDNTKLDFHSGKLTDASPAHAKKLAERERRSLAILRSYPREGLTESQRLSTDILEWYIDSAVRDEPFLFHDYPVNPMTGVQRTLPEFMDKTHQVTDERSAKRYIERLSRFGVKFDQVLEGLRLRESRGIIPPKPVIGKTVDAMRAFIETPAEQNILFVSFKQKLNRVESLTPESKNALRASAQVEIQQIIYPAYRKLIAYCEALESKATEDLGVWKLPNGDAYYSYKLREATTTDLTPEEVHQIGLREVARTEAEMHTILDALGFKGKTVSEHMRALAKQPQFLYLNTDAGRAQILADTRQIVDEIQEDLTEVFRLRPTQRVNVERAPKYLEENAPARAWYEQPALDGSRPPVFYLNLKDLSLLPRFTLQNTAYHEAVPGHHFQMAIAQKLQGVPTFRNVIPFEAFHEGWATYAERLAFEQGFYRDPYSRLYRLSQERSIAGALVLDTGIHYKRWSRQQATDYALAHGDLEQQELEKIILPRHALMPGQSCAYKIGAMRIVELREKARRELGTRFDIRDFHDVVLRDGAMPLTILEKQVQRYIQTRKAAAQ